MSPIYDPVEETPESLTRSYPRSAVETPNVVFDDGGFQFGLANFLSRPDAVDSDSPLPPPTDPQYINALLNGVLQSFGRAVDVLPVSEHVHDDVNDVWIDPCEWAPSDLWFLVRVAIQMTANRSLGGAFYNGFMLFFTCTLANDEGNTTLSNDLLHLMSCRILRRLSELGSSTLSEMALKTCNRLREILDARWERLRGARAPQFRNPSQDELTRDTQLSLLHSGEYIRNALADTGSQLLGTPFHPSHRRRGNIEDFLSSNGTFFQEAYDADRDVALYDVERSVEEGIDDWVACVADVDEACAQLEILMDKYMMKACERTNPEEISIALLTGMELYVALDKLAVKEIPMLADYPPEITISFLEELLLGKTTSLHRLSCVYQYLSARHSHSRLGSSVLSDKFTEDSFPVRYYDQSPHLQQLKARIDDDTMQKTAGRAGPQLEGASLPHTYDGYQEYQQHLPGRQLAECAQSPLPVSPLHAKVVVFELQCPACVRIWRSAAPRVLSYFSDRISDGTVIAGEHLLARVPALQPYFVKRRGPRLRIQSHFAYFYPKNPPSRSGPMLVYVLQRHDTRRSDTACLWAWKPRGLEGGHSFNLRYGLEDHCPSCKVLTRYVDHTSHTPNDILSAQVDCPADLPLDEFVAFAHLRSGGSLQWLNILQGLRSRALNLRRHQVHFLLAHAAFQVGPLDLNTGTWVWHQELQDSCFCNSLLDELHSLIVDVGSRSIDGVLMSNVSLLLTRVLASSPSEGVSDRVFALLRSVRRKTFDWVQEISYDLTKAPRNEERRNALRDMAATCRSTFDVDASTLRKLFYSAEDVDALLSCAFFMRALYPKCTSGLRIPTALNTCLASIQLFRDR